MKTGNENERLLKLHLFVNALSLKEKYHMNFQIARSYNVYLLKGLARSHVVCIILSTNNRLDFCAFCCNHEYSILSCFRHLHFVTTIEVKGETYVGESGNKKDSKVFAAVNALKGAFDIQYPAFPTQENELGAPS